MSSGTRLHLSDVDAMERRASTDSRFPVELPIYGCAGSASCMKASSHDNQVLQGSKNRNHQEINNNTLYYVHI